MVLLRPFRPSCHMVFHRFAIGLLLAVVSGISGLFISEPFPARAWSTFSGAENHERKLYYAGTPLLGRCRGCCRACFLKRPSSVRAHNSKSFAH